MIPHDILSPKSNVILGETAKRGGTEKIDDQPE